MDRNQLTAAAEPDIVKNSQGSSSVSEAPAATKTYKELSRSEKKQLRSELKDYIKNHSKKLKTSDEVASVNATKQLDDDLKLAIIFGAVGITFAILGGINTVFWVIGVIGLIVGLVFFIRWISTQ
jgi:Ca2+-dependent lipid-binding protein